MPAYPHVNSFPVSVAATVCAEPHANRTTRTPSSAEKKGEIRCIYVCVLCVYVYVWPQPHASLTTRTPSSGVTVSRINAAHICACTHTCMHIFIQTDR
jgi:hypothetical protein